MFDCFSATIPQIKEFCERNPLNALRPPEDGDDKIYKLSEDVVVKYGPGVTDDEAANQRFAYKHFNGQGIRIPRVIRYLSVDDEFGRLEDGCIIMEYLHGQHLNGFPDDEIPSLADKVARCLQRFHETFRDFAGPLAGGIPDGSFWGNIYPVERPLPTPKELERWLNRRLGKVEGSINLEGIKFCFCHLDIHRRNILLLPDGSLGFIDWSSAGFYPRAFEISFFTVWGNVDPEFYSALQKRLLEIKSEDENLLKLLHWVFWYQQLGTFREGNPKPVKVKYPLVEDLNWWHDHHEFLHLHHLEAVEVLRKWSNGSKRREPPRQNS